MSLPTPEYVTHEPATLLVDPITGNDLVRWSVSSTDIVTTRHANPDIEPLTEVTHVANFTMVPGTVEDVPMKYSRGMLLRPDHMTAVWRDGRLTEIAVSGPQVLKNGGTSDKNRRRTEWAGAWSRELGGNAPIDKDTLPAPLGKVLATYETQVAQASVDGGDQ